MAHLLTQGPFVGPVEALQVDEALAVVVLSRGP